MNHQISIGSITIQNKKGKMLKIVQKGHWFIDIAKFHKEYLEYNSTYLMSREEDW